MPSRVLIADDDALFRRSLEAVVRALGYEVVAVDSGADAVAVIARERFDVVLLDQRMPVLSGVEAWARIRALPTAPGAVLVTAATDGEAIARQNGMRFLAKPFGVEELRTTLTLAIGGPR